MINEKILSALSDADDVLIVESVPGINSVPANRTRRRSRRFRAAIVAASVVLVCGAVAYATGILTAPFSIYRSAEAEVKNRTMLVDGVEVDFIDIDVQVPLISQSEVRGALRTDLEALMQKTMEIEGTTADWVKLDEDGMGRTDENHCEILKGKIFDDQQKALDYIGLKNYEIQYFPYEKCTIYVYGHATTTREKGVSGMGINSCMYEIKSPDEKISVELWTDCGLVYGKPKKGAIGNMGIGGFRDDGSVTVETFTNAHGYNGAKAYASDGSAEKYSITGLVVKNNVQYLSNISCEWEDKEEADQIFINWAEHF